MNLSASCAAIAAHEPGGEGIDDCGWVRLCGGADSLIVCGVDVVVALEEEAVVVVCWGVDGFPVLPRASSPWFKFLTDRENCLARAFWACSRPMTLLLKVLSSSVNLSTKVLNIIKLLFLVIHVL